MYTFVLDVVGFFFPTLFLQVVMFSLMNLVFNYLCIGVYFNMYLSTFK